jgi:hypothetical protein
MGIIQDIKNAVVPDGDYVIEIVPGSAVESFDRAGESVRFEIEIVDGDRRGVRIPIRFLLRGNERTAGIAGRDCSVFLKWADCLGVKDADTPTDAIKLFWKAQRSRGLRLVATLRAVISPSTGWRGVIVTDVRLEQPQ